MIENKKNNTEINELFDTVVKNGFCIGCGICASVTNSPIKIKFDEYRRLQATVENDVALNSDVNVLSVCPFSNKSLNEDILGKELFSNDSSHSNKLGYYKGIYAGHINSSDLRRNSSSGGIGTWLLGELIKQNIIDGVIHVHANKPTDQDPKLFKYLISTTIDQVNKGAKSRYYPMELSEILQKTKSLNGKYAIVGLPCFIKGVRLLLKQDAILREKIKFCIGLVCGHSKSANFASMAAWNLGFNPKNVTSIDFRTKLPDQNANRYGMTVDGYIDGESVSKVSKPVSSYFGFNWGWGFFKYKACDYCDDVVAETSDISIGDAWLPEYISDPKGTSLIIVRNPSLHLILKKAHDNKEINLVSISAEMAEKSQDASFRHRRDSLAYRLYIRKKENKWSPIKRIRASNYTISKKTKKIQKLRLQISAKSHVAFAYALKEDSLQLFEDTMKSLILEYNALNKWSIWKKAFAVLKNIIAFLKNRIKK